MTVYSSGDQKGLTDKIDNCAKSLSPYARLVSNRYRQMFPNHFYCSQACVKRIQTRTKHIFPEFQSYYQDSQIDPIKFRQAFKVTTVHEHACPDRVPDRLLFIKLLLFKILPTN